MVHFLKIDLPLLKDSVVSKFCLSNRLSIVLIYFLASVVFDIKLFQFLGLIDDAFNVLTHDSFMSAISEEYPLIILVSFYAKLCNQLTFHYFIYITYACC